MDAARAVRVGVVGADNISRQYLTTLTSADDVEVTSVADLFPENARALADEFAVADHGSYEQLLERGDVELVVNLTIPASHAQVTLAALLSGRHVWSEKPLALTRDAAAALVREAADRGLLLGCAPDTFLGPGLQTALRALRSGRACAAAAGRVGDPPRAALTGLQRSRSPR